MKLVSTLFAILLFSLQLIAQEPIAKDTSWKKQYRETATKINDLVHTKLDVKPDFSVNPICMEKPGSH